MKEAIFFCIVGLPPFGNEGSGTPVFKILVRALYYDNVESLYGLKCHFVHVYQYQSDNCCQSVTGAANNQQLEDIYLADFSIQIKSHLVWDLYLLPKLHSQ